MRKWSEFEDDSSASVRLRDAALLAFRGRVGACRPEWIQIMGVAFPHIAAGALRMVLRTPFQRIDHLVTALDLDCPARLPSYRLDIWWRRKVFCVTWDDPNDIDLRHFDDGPWVGKLLDLADAAQTGPSEVEFQFGSARAAYRSGKDAGSAARAGVAALTRLRPGPVTEVAPQGATPPPGTRP